MTNLSFLPMPPSLGPPLPQALMLFWPGKGVSVGDWAGTDPEDHERRVRIAASYGIEYRYPTWYNPATGESMPYEVMADIPGWHGEGSGGSFQTEANWINGQIIKGASFWPYKPEEKELAHCCPYCTECFDSLDELISHVAAEHPDKPPLERIEIEWE